ncbi:MAG: hypothetical protein KDB61_11835 [Planctomycetes bacterium]|nr:hypothetical protein [Planctomycetota bacterium]
MKATQILTWTLVPLTLALASCTSENSETPTEPAGGAQVQNAANEAADKGAEAINTAASEMDGQAAEVASNLIEGVHPVECGCSDAVGKGQCGNYVQIADTWYEIEGDLGLGHMEWCQQSGNKAQVKGKIEGNKFMGESLTAVP